MSNEPESPTKLTQASHRTCQRPDPVDPFHDIAASVARIEAAPTLAEKGRLLREMPPPKPGTRPWALCPRPSSPP